MKRMSLVGLILLGFMAAQAQIKAVEDFLKEYPDLDKYYIYQSTLRMLNQDGNEDFNRMIKDIRKINAYVAEGSSDVTRDSYNKMIDRLSKDDFEVYVKAKMEETFVNLMGRDEGKDSYFVLAVHDDDNFALLEMDGQIDLSYLTALDDIDFGKLQEIILKQDEDNGNDH